MEWIESVHCQWVSEYIRELCLDVQSGSDPGTVIPWGVDEQYFTYSPKARSGVVRMLYVGQVVPHKGVATATRVARELARVLGSEEVRLTVAGGTVYPDYLLKLKEELSGDEFGRCVTFLGGLKRGAIRDLYRTHDVLLFPSEWDEPFSITILEAMASGIAVVGTSTGGSAEILRHRENAMVFEKGNASDAASCVLELVRQQSLATLLRKTARNEIERRYTLSQMIVRIEEDILRYVTSMQESGDLRVPRPAHSNSMLLSLLCHSDSSDWMQKARTSVGRRCVLRRARRGSRPSKASAAAQRLGIW
jgi:glycosyltransferase involved in cell wall biosynthesis